MENIKIVSDIFGADELYELLKKQVPENCVQYLEVKEKPVGTMPMDATVLVALISAGGLTIKTLITNIAVIWQKKIESMEKKTTVVIKLKGKDGVEIEAPADIKEDKLDEFIKKAEKIASFKYIALKEKD